MIKRFSFSECFIRMYPHSLIVLKIMKITFANKQKCCMSNLPFSFILHYVLAYSIILKTGTPVEVKQLSDTLIFFSLFFQGNSSSDSLRK